MDLETALACHHWDNVTLRDPQKTYNLEDREQAADLLPALRLWFDGLDLPEDKTRRTGHCHPGLLHRRGRPARAEDRCAPGRSGWPCASSPAPRRYLSSAFVDANFAFYGTTLSGTPRNKERWKRGVALVEGALGEAVGQIYVAQHFPEAHKARMETLVANLIEAYRQSITCAGPG